MINPIALGHFFEAMCHGIFKYLLTVSSKNKRFLGFIFNYFGIVETNSPGILYLNCVIWLCDDFHITQLYKQLQVNYKYAALIVEFINHIIRYFIIPEDEIDIPQSNTLVVSLNYKSNSSFVL